MSAISLVYCVCLVLIIAFLADIPADAECLGGYFPCMPLSEIGDALAGIFAPLAFLWLVAAVMVQSQELQEQRRELELTRNEFQLTRDVAVESKGVAEAQAKAAHAQAQAVEIQNEILREQLEAQRKVNLDEDFSLLLDQLDTALLARLNGKLEFHTQRGVMTMINFPPGTLPDERDHRLVHVSRAILNDFNIYSADYLAPETAQSRENRESLQHVHGILVELLKRDDALSGHHRILGQTIQLDDLARLLAILIERISIAGEPPT
jgi:hypothetical protein